MQPEVNSRDVIKRTSGTKCVDFRDCKRYLNQILYRDQAPNYHDPKCAIAKFSYT